MKTKLKKIYGNSESSTAARWAPVADGSVMVHLRPFRNPDAREAYSRFERRYGRVQRRGALDNKIHVREVSKIVAQHVLIGWSGMSDMDGNDIPWSRETAEAILVEEPDFLSDILDASNMVGADWTDDIEEAKAAGKKE